MEAYFKKMVETPGLNFPARDSDISDDFVEESFAQATEFLEDLFLWNGSGARENFYLDNCRNVQSTVHEQSEQICLSTKKRSA